MDINTVKKCAEYLQSLTRRSSPLNYNDVQNAKNHILSVVTELGNDQSLLGKRLRKLNDELFPKRCAYNKFNYYKMGRILEILDIITEQYQNKIKSLWEYIHPRIVAVSQDLYLTGNYANASLDAFIEINARMKNLYEKLNPNKDKIPDGVDLMHKIMDADDTKLWIGNKDTETGKNIQQGYRFMLAGAISALRNPKAHSNDEKLSAEESMRRLMFASMLIYKIDEAAENAKIEE